MRYYKGCVVNNDSAFEVFERFDSEGHLFFAVYEDIPEKLGAIREQSVYLTRGQAQELITHLQKALSHCSICNGTGIESYYNHGYGEHSVEPIKCKDCDGFGRVQEDK